MSSLEQRRLAKELGIDPAALHLDTRDGPELPESFDELPFACCMSAAMYGFRACTCWEPVYDQEQADPDLTAIDRAAAEFGLSRAQASALIVVARPRCCADCAYRNGSPEREQGYDAELADLAGDGSRFFCHDGMRRIIGWRHPDIDAEIREFFPTGLVPAGPGDYRPPIVDGVCFRADGTPADLCGGWNAHRNALGETTWAKRFD